jgi:hypothetical protein
VVPPVVINENGDVSVYETADSAARKLEPIDVRNNEYTAFDSEAYPLQLVAGEYNVSIPSRTGAPANPDLLVSILRSFLDRASGQPLSRHLSTPRELLALYIERYGYSR